MFVLLKPFMYVFICLVKTEQLSGHIMKIAAHLIYDMFSLIANLPDLVILGFPTSFIGVELQFTMIAPVPDHCLLYPLEVLVFKEITEIAF